MKNFLLSALVAATLLLSTSPARADQTDTVRTANTVMYVGEALDCGNTALANQEHGSYETNPYLAYQVKHTHTILSRAVAVCGSYAVYDIVAGALLRKSPAGSKVSFALTQFGTNVYGVAFTFHNLHR